MNDNGALTIRELSELFTIKPEIIDDNGISDFVILKFRNHYLRIKLDINNFYTIEVHKYNQGNPTFTDTVHISNIRQWIQINQSQLYE